MELISTGTEKEAEVANPATFGINLAGCIINFAILIIFSTLEVCMIYKVSIKNINFQRALNFLILSNICFLSRAFFQLNKVIFFFKNEQQIYNQYALYIIRMMLFLIETFTVYLVVRFIIDMKQVLIKLRAQSM